jgi:alkylhydroperoxidase family enzyme
VLRGPSRAVGVTDTQRAALAAKQWDSPEFNEAQRALIAFTAAIADAPTVAGDIFDAAQKHYTDQQIVELIIQTGYYFLLARVSTVLDVPLDPPSDDRVLRAGVALAGGSLS